MSQLYLIVHKVRGQPAFDIAEKIDIGGEEGWIIPTSGHRAYPYWTELLSNYVVSMQCIDGSTKWFESFNEESGCGKLIPPMPSNLPDHYPAEPSRERTKDPSRIADMLSRMGLRSGQPVKRRI